MESELRLEILREEETGLLFEMITEMAEYERLTDMVVGTSEILRESIFKRKAARALLARVGGEVVGYALWCYNFSSFECKPGLYLEDIFIRPAHRRKGYGEAILRHLAALAVQEDCARMEWVVLDWNQPAIDFYAKMGAEMLQEWRINRLSGDTLRDAGKGAHSPTNAL